VGRGEDMRRFKDDAVAPQAQPAPE